MGLSLEQALCVVMTGQGTALDPELLSDGRRESRLCRLDLFFRATSSSDQRRWSYWMSSSMASPFPFSVDENSLPCFDVSLESELVSLIGLIPAAVADGLSVPAIWSGDTGKLAISEDESRGRRSKISPDGSGKRSNARPDPGRATTGPRRHEPGFGHGASNLSSHGFGEIGLKFDRN